MPPETADGSLDDIRAQDVNAIWRMFREYGRDKQFVFGVGAVASVLSRAMELVPAYILAVTIDTLTTRWSASAASNSRAASASGSRSLERFWRIPTSSS
ncbi:hypothetical protein OB955_19640 [Halobacteria archaeon AArc-m2/3/4]|uniref:ATP-binding cassette, subfamily B n=1 Tax=Natronoglomus mannanivorans TaxID=2979990 RepID=A0AAP3E4Y9_9EURY|nr:hypothetical protein [Halobacteria archaeon AArc-xg1-1]MCU4974936.1 hypothetical protein [Halobacteria archaeon AArc-m2/3/4]